MSLNVVDVAHTWLCWLMAGCGAVTFALLMLTIQAPYGRYFKGSAAAWGPPIEARVAWMTQELPALLVPLCLLCWSSPPPVLEQLDIRSCLLAAFLCHYSYRALLYPCLIRGGKSTPAAVWAMALAFCVWNGFLQGWFLLHQLPPGLPWQPRHLAGLALWLAGWLANLKSDATLRGLRRSAGDTGYKVPRGGLFEFVSAANYFAEIVEWVGFALAAYSHLAPAVFAAFTFANLAPRGAQHHAWYKSTFTGYPSTRKAVIPFVW